MTRTLAVRNAAQKTLLEQELFGQISDGMWENTLPHNHYQDWMNVDVVVDPTNLGRDFYAFKDNYQLVSAVLLDCVGQRMVESVRAMGGQWVYYSFARMLVDLRDLKKIMRTHRQVVDERFTLELALRQILGR